MRTGKTAQSLCSAFATGGREMAIAASENYRLLRKQGCTPRNHRLLHCYILPEGRHALLHRDREFERFEKYLALRVIRP
jgi:predicted nucleic acid-binding protein